MTRSYLTSSPVGWASLLAILFGFALKFVAPALGWPMWLVPVSYFIALVGSAALFIGWVRFQDPALRD